MRRARIELVLASFLMLFTELVLIRWTGANVTYLSYFSNFVLLGSFLGIGIGFLRAKKGPDLFRWAPVVLVFFTAFVTAFPVVIDRTGSDLIFFGSLNQRGLPAWLMLPLIFVAVAAALACIAHGVAVRFATFEALEAYRLDIFGSLLGILAFSLLAFLGTGPLAWSIVISALFVILLGPGLRPLQITALLGLVGLFAIAAFQGNTIWSPYYKIQQQEGEFEGRPARAISVNGIPHQTISPVGVIRDFQHSYFMPYERAAGNSLGNVLIIGAGSGNDVGIALSQGAHHVDAVEIDPELQELGIQFHPDRPYQDPRVERIVTDGRAFLENTDRTYDLILFALPDSLTLVSGQSGIRLESFLFTRQAIEAAQARLAPGGAFAIYNYYRQDWLEDRLAGTLRDVFGAPPCIDSKGLFQDGDDIGRFTVMTDAVGGQGVSCKTTWDPDGREVVAPATDDHPFVYLRSNSIPARYLVTLALVLLASAVVVRVAGGRYREMAGAIDLFFMGAAFLLLETKNVVQFALLFGTTWFVNALVFAGILLTVLLAVEVERRFRIGRPGLLYSLLFVSLGVAALVPASALLDMSSVPRFLAASALAFAPVFIANLVFAGRFRDAPDPTAAFGANLLGAMVGGALEYLSLVTGYRALLLLAAALYGLAWIFGRRHVTAEKPSVERIPVGATAEG